jgi:hypothetical protein
MHENPREGLHALDKGSPFLAAVLEGQNGMEIIIPGYSAPIYINHA